MIDIPTPGEMLKLSSQHPLLNAVLQLWKAGKVSWDQAMMVAVKALLVHNEEILRNAVSMVSQHAHPMIVPFPFPIPPGHDPTKPPGQATPQPPPAPEAPQHHPGPMPSPSKLDPEKVLHVLVNEICTCGATHSTSPEDHNETCRGNTLIRRLRGETP